MGKILSYAYLLVVALFVATYGQSNLPQSVQTFVSYQYMRIESVFGASSGHDVGAAETAQSVAVVRVR